MSNKNIILHPIDQTTGELDTNTNLYPKTIAENVEGLEDLDDIRDGAEAGATAVQPNVIEDMATKTWATQQGWQNSNQVDSKILNHNESNLAHQDIRDSIPTKTSDIVNDTGFITNSALQGYATNERVNELEDSIPNIIDNVTSTSTNSGLSANQGKLLNDRINNVASRGRFLSLWNCVTGMPLTNPSGYPYTYHTGDFFIVNNTGTTNYIPNGSQYIGQPSTTVYSGDIKVNDTIFYDGTIWSVFTTPAGSGNVQDVYQNGSSVLSSGIAYITTPTKTSDITNDSGFITSSALSNYATQTWVTNYVNEVLGNIENQLSSI